MNKLSFLRSSKPASKSSLSSTQDISVDTDSSLSSLKEKIGSLEKKNSALEKTLENMIQLQSKADLKINLLEAKIEALNSENMNLKIMLTQARKELEEARSHSKDTFIREGMNEVEFIDEEGKQDSRIKPPRGSNRSEFVLEIEGNNQEVLTSTDSYKDHQVPQMNESPLLFDEDTPMRGRSKFHSTSELNQLIKESFEEGYNSFDKAAIGGKKEVNLRKFQSLDNRHSHDNDNSFKAERLFDNFLIVSFTKETVGDILAKSEENKHVEEVEKKILFDFAKSSKIKTDLISSSIAAFFPPTQFPVRECAAENEIDKVFYEVALESWDCKEKYIFPLESQVSKNEWAKDLEAINPHHKLYAVCVRKDDYYVIESQDRSQNRFIVISTIYCFLTYYPIPELFFNFIGGALDVIRKKRREVFWEGNRKDKARVDFSMLDEIFLEDLTRYLFSIMLIGTPSPGQSIRYSLNDEQANESELQKYDIPQRAYAFFPLLSWNAAKIFSIFSMKNIKMILSAILLEKNIVFFSTDIMLLTTAINTFMGLLFPFKYTCPVIALLPSEHMQACGAPFPTIIGINRSEKEFWRERLMMYSQCMFVFLDSKRIYASNAEGGVGKFPILDFATKDIKDIYKRANPTNSKFDVVNDTLSLAEKHYDLIKNQNKKSPAPEKTHTEKQDLFVVQQISNHFKNYIEKNVIKFRAALNDLAGDPEIKKLIKDDKIRQFFFAFKGTMTFNNYPYSVSLAYRQQQ